MDELTLMKMFMQLQSHILEASKIISQHEASIQLLQAAVLELYRRQGVEKPNEILKH